MSLLQRYWYIYHTILCFIYILLILILECHTVISDLLAHVFKQILENACIDHFIGDIGNYHESFSSRSKPYSFSLRLEAIDGLSICQIIMATRNGF